MEALSRVVFQFLILIQWVVDIVDYVLCVKEKRKPVPRNSNRLLYSSATELAEKIRNQKISSVELTATYINRIKEVNPIINAIIENRFTKALSEAEQIDLYLKESKASSVDIARSKPLLGIPITVKECLAVKDLSYTGCTLSRKDIKAAEDAAAIKLLRDAGAIVLLVSSTPEYCACIETSNNIIGRTKNPYDTRYNSGGSSGGEVALLGSGASLIGMGTGVAGSISIPSSFNGVYGHKPTTGIVPHRGAFSMPDDKRFLEYMVVGPMCRYVEDLELTLKVLTKDSSEGLNFDQTVDFKKLSLYYMEDSGYELGLLKVDPLIKKAIKGAVRYLNEEYGCQINYTKFPEMGSSMEVSSSIYNLDNPPNIFTDSEIKYDPRTEFIKFLFGKYIFTFPSFLFASLGSMTTITEKERKSFLERAAAFKIKFANTLGDNGIFLFPSFPTEAFKHNQFVRCLTGMRFLAIINMIGCPATNIPIGLSKNGLPLSLQVIAAPHKDNLCIDVAKKLDKYFGGWIPPY